MTHIEAELYGEAAPSPQPVAERAAVLVPTSRPLPAEAPTTDLLSRLDDLEKGAAQTLDVRALEAMRVRLQALSGAVTDRLVTALKQQNECSSADEDGNRVRPA